jgi:flagellar hook protein FlgE
MGRTSAEEALCCRPKEAAAKIRRLKDMQRSLFTAISGLNNHQTKLDVIGNNIANVNTTAYKAGRVRFSDILNQTLRGASAPQAGRGGINPMQVGLGMQIAAIDNNHTQGNLQSTGRELDMAIQGSGFFVVSDGSQYFYTRDGAFSRGSDGFLVNSANGMRVMGWIVGEDGAIDTTLAPTSLNIPLGFRAEANATEHMIFRGNLNAGIQPFSALAETLVDGSAAENEIQRIQINNAQGGTFTLTFQGETTGPIPYNASADQMRTVLESLPTAIDPGDITVAGTPGGPWTIEFGGPLANTNIEQISIQTDNLISQYSLEMDIYDSLGNVHTMEIQFEKSGVNQWNWDSYLKDGGNHLGTGSGMITFNPHGGVAAGQQGTFILDPIPAGSSLVGSDPIEISLDFSALSQLVGVTDALLQHQDGFPMGILNEFTVGSTGVITGTYSNGMVTSLGQIALGRFENPEGLMKVGGNLYQSTSNSGEVFIGIPGTQGRGIIERSTLEMSNVNIAYEFTEIITTTRAFQANSRVITSSDELLQEVVNLKR